MSDMEDLRNSMMIEERENYEQQFFEHIVDVMIEDDALNMLIKDRLNYIEDNFDYFEYDGSFLDELFYYENDVKSQELRSDVDDYIDYPEGYDDAGDEFYNQPDFYEFIYEDLMIDIEYDEPEYFENQAISAILEENLFEKAIDEYIFEKMDIEYPKDEIEYEDTSWYSQFEPQLDMEPPQENIQFEKYQDNLIKNHESDKNTDELVKDYFARNENLNMIIRKKLKEKKFK